MSKRNVPQIAETSYTVFYIMIVIMRDLNVYPDEEIVFSFLIPTPLSVPHSHLSSVLNSKPGTLSVSS